MVTTFISWLWAQQDYFWFLAGFGWLLVLGRWYATEPGLRPAWVAWSAMAGILTMAIELLILITPVQFKINMPQSPRGDFALGLVGAAHAGAWWWCGLRSHHRSRWIAAAIFVLLLGAATVRPVALDAGNGGITLAAILAAVVLWRADASGREWRWALVAVLLATIIGTGGLVARIIGEPPRAWTELSRIGLLAAIMQVVAAMSVWQAFSRQKKIGWGSEDERAQEERRLVFYLTAGGIAGLVFAWLVGWRALISFENSAFDRARTAVQLMDIGAFERALDRNFQVVNPHVWRDPIGGSLQVANRSEHLRIVGAAAVAQLSKVARANPDIERVFVTTLRDGWLTRVLFDDTSSPARGNITLVRPVSANDLIVWAERSPLVRTPSLAGPTSSAGVSVPMFTPAGRFLGWLEFGFTPSTWVAAQAQARFLACGIVGLGLVVSGLSQAHRRRLRERDSAEAAARRAQLENTVKTTFLGKVSHELRTPLQSITSCADLLLLTAVPRDRGRLVGMRQQAELMVRLVNDLIDLSALDSGSFSLIERPVAVAEIVRQTLESFRPRAEAKGLRLDCGIDPAIPGWLRADAERFRQVVINLIGNAVKYTDRGGVEVQLRLLSARDSNYTVELSVCDTGPGIPPQEQQRLFEPFSRLELTSQKEGTGLGLAVAAGICRAFGGGIRVESDGVNGSRFVAHCQFVLDQAPVEERPVSLSGLKVLVADDNALVRELFVAYLVECGAMCATAADGVEALARLRTEKFDALAIDLAMPRADGLTVTRDVRADSNLSQMRIIGISAHAGASEREQALRAGMDAFLVKPIEAAQLARALAPDATMTVAAPTLQKLRAEAMRLFRNDAHLQAARVAEAWQKRDWQTLFAAAHYLKNSAFVVEDEALSAACAALQNSAECADEEAAGTAWNRCRQALVKWTTPPSNFPAGDPPVDLTSTKTQ